MTDLTDKYDLYNELECINEELEALRKRAKCVVAHLPSHLRARAEAYAVAEFGTSDNPYDTTFETIGIDFHKELFVDNSRPH